jgi:hypothetical protein
MNDEFPVGDEFLALAATGEQACEKHTLESGKRLGRKAPECRHLLGTVLSMLYREACCFYGCVPDDHLPQRIAGRITSNALSSFRLLVRGYYDESFNLTRSIGEAANLLFLCTFRREEFERWRNANDRDRWNMFKPAMVRASLKKAGLPVPIDDERYRLLCSIAVHLGPEVSPQAHQPERRPTLGSYYRQESYLAALNELAGATGVASSGLLWLLPKARKEKLKAASVALLRSVGGLDLAAVRQMEFEGGDPAKSDSAVRDT